MNIHTMEPEAFFKTLELIERQLKDPEQRHALLTEAAADTPAVAALATVLQMQQEGLIGGIQASGKPLQHLVVVLAVRHLQIHSQEDPIGLN